MLLQSILVISSVCLVGAAPLQTRQSSNSDDYLHNPSTSRTSTEFMNYETTTEAPFELEFYHSLQELEKSIAPIFDTPLDRSEVDKVLRRAMDILHHTRGRSRVADNYTARVKRMLRGMTCDPNIGSSSSDESRPSPKKKSEDAGFCQLAPGNYDRRTISDSTKRKILAPHDEGKTTSAIQRLYSWFRPNYIKRFRESCCSNEASQASRIEEINNYVTSRAEEVMQANAPLRDYMLVRWAMQRAGKLNARSFFTASNRWLWNFKKRNNIVSRKITAFITEASMRNENDTQASIARFHQACIGQAIRFPPRLMFKVDQTGFNYEVYRDRTLARKVQRDVEIAVDSQSKGTHSYTAQPMISRDGRTSGKLLICLQERNDQFGPRVGPSIRDMESRFNNILVVASKSDKMTQVLMREWIDRVLAPALQEEVDNAFPEEVVGDGGLYDPEDDNLFAGDGRRMLRPEVLGEQPDESNFNCAMDFIRRSYCLFSEYRSS